MAYCPSCGTEMPDNARFCSQCGAAILAKADTPPATPAAPPGSAAAPPPTNPVAASSAAGKAPAPVNAAEPMWTGWPSRKRHLPMLMTAAVVLLAPLIAWAILRPPQTPLSVGLLAVAGLGLLWCLWIAGTMLVEPMSLSYWVTIDRLFVRRGLFSRTTDQTELIRVDDLRVTQGLVDRLLGIGNVEVVASTDRTDGDIVLRGVQDPMHVAELVRENMRKLRQRRGMYVENV